MRVFFAIALFQFFASVCFSQTQVNQLRCENLANPIGIDIQQPQLSWQLISEKRNCTQTAYEIKVGRTLQLDLDKKVLQWSSGKIKSSESLHIIYKGKKLEPAKKYYWQVRVWDNNGKVSAWSDVQHFTTGLFIKSDWGNAKWIGYEELADSMRVAPGIHEPLASSLGNKCIQRPVVPLFRKKFNINKKIKNALLFVTGLGQYEVKINGVKAGNAFLAPGWTYYDKTVLYNTYDVTDKLLSGDNTIGAIVGNGFYNINRERYFKITSAFGMPAMLCRLKIEYADSTVSDIVSDKSWKTAPSPIIFSSIYGGEDYDAGLEQNEWDKNLYNDAGWKNALETKAPVGKLISEKDYPVAIMDSFQAQNKWTESSGVNMYDFGQNISGIVSIKVKGKKGQTIKIIPSELLDTNRLPNQSASGGPFYFSYTLKGEGIEEWQPKFTYYGFRYVQVVSANGANADNNTEPPSLIEIKALHNRNSNPENGSFNCSNELFNRIYTLIKWAIKSNMQSVITDCPHREKLSWLEEDYLMGASIHYNYDIHNLYRKLVYDMMDAQYAEGFIPDIAPEFVVFGGGFLDSPEWGSAAVIVPWLLYEWYGDKDILEKAYPMMKKYAAYLQSKSVNNILSHGLGDWFDYGPRQPGEAQLTPKELTATSIYYYDLSLLSKMAAILNFKNDAVAFKNKAAAVKKSFNNKFFNAAKNVYSTGSQTAMAMPLCVGLADERNKKIILKNLIDSIYANNKALTAGDIGFHFLIKALDEGGASQLIYDMNNRDDVPGYGFQLKKGATALTESWPALENVSNNHLMLGHIMEWFYSGLAGISQEENSVTFKHIKIRPQPVGDITHASGSFHSPYGWIKSEWKKQPQNFTLNVQVPGNTTATIYLPAKKTSVIIMNNTVLNNQKIKINDSNALITIGSGNYSFEVK